MDGRSNSGPLDRQRLRSPRVDVDFIVDLEVCTPEGEHFAVKARAVRASRAGGTLITDAPVTVGSIVRLTMPFGRMLEAEVNGVWKDETDGAQRIGVKVLNPHGWFGE
jgi:hypothetical protein